MASTEAYLNKTASEVPASPFYRLVNAVEDMRSLEARVNELANRLAGSAPMNQTAMAASLKEVGPGGLIDTLEDQTGALNSIANDLRSHLSRIENRL